MSIDYTNATDQELRDAIAETVADIDAREVDAEGAERAAVTIGECLDEIERRGKC